MVIWRQLERTGKGPHRRAENHSWCSEKALPAKVPTIPDTQPVKLQTTLCGRRLASITSECQTITPCKGFWTKPAFFRPTSAPKPLQAPFPTGKQQETTTRQEKGPVTHQDQVGECHTITRNSKQPIVIGGRLEGHVNKWTKLTSDRSILDAVTGYKIEFLPECDPPIQNKPVFQHKMAVEETYVIDGEISKLHQKGVIEQSHHECGQYISPIFIRPKKDGGYRMILDLSELNKNVEYHHFKMDTFQTTIQLVYKDCFMASIDLRDAYYSVPINIEHRKYLKFSFNGKLWNFKCLPTL